jgi:hypothetical protein
VTRRQKQVIVVATAVLAGILFAAEPLRSALEGSAEVRRAPRAVSTAASPSPTAPIEEDGYDSYAVALEELPGLAPDAAPGTRLQLWVAWEPPIVRRPRIDLLLKDVVLARIVQPLSPRGRGTALLLLKPPQVSDVLYADRYGGLSAVVTDGAP